MRVDWHAGFEIDRSSVELSSNAPLARDVARTTTEEGSQEAAARLARVAHIQRKVTQGCLRSQRRVDLKDWMQQIREIDT